MSRPIQPPRAAPGGIRLAVRRNGQDLAADDFLAATVGEVYEITAVLDGEPAWDCQWTVPVQGVVQDYQPTLQGAAPVPVGPADLASNPITLAFWQPDAYVISVVGMTPEGVAAGLLEVEVSAPVATLVDTTFGVVRAGPGDENAQWLQLAGNNGQPLGHEQTGIGLNGSVSAAPLGGTIGFIQLVTPSRGGVEAGQPVVFSLNGQPVLDASGDQASALYGDLTAQVPAGGEADLPITDAPAIYVTPEMNWSDMAVGQEVFQTFLMYQPPGGIFVPLSVIEWYWGGQTVQANGAWGAAQNTAQLVGVAQSPTEFPVWTNNVTASAYVPAAAPRGRAGVRRRRTRQLAA
jgi:hypothetical protein